jgi:hypothetical protein
VFEPNETFVFELSQPVNATLGNARATATIRNDETAPTLSIGDVRIQEGDSGATDAVFTVRLTPASSQPVTIDFSTVDDSALAGTDYLAINGRLTFQPASPTATPPAETPDLRWNRAGAQWQLSWTSLPGAFELQERSSLSESGDWSPVLEPVTVNGDEHTVMVANSETLKFYRLFPKGLSLGETEKRIVVTIRFLVVLSSPVNATLARSQGEGLIVNDDAAPTLSISDVTVVEGNIGTTPAVYTVTLAGSSSQAVTVHYSSANPDLRPGRDEQEHYGPGQRRCGERTG